MNSWWDKRTSQREHLDERRQASGISEVISELAFGQAVASRGFYRNHPRAALPLDLAAQVGHHQTREIRSATRTTDNYVRFVPGDAHLFYRLQPDYGLVQQDVIENTSE